MSDDVWSTSLFQSSFGGVAFDCLATQDSIARAIARHSFPRRPGANLEDMGAEPRSTRCRILFWERAGEVEGDEPGNHLVRFAAFKAAVDLGKIQDFVHPVTGSYRAAVEEFSFSADAEERDVIEVDCTFVEDTTQPARFDPGAQQTVDSGAAAVDAQAKLAAADLTTAGIVSDVPGNVSSKVAAWEANAEMSVRQVNLELAKITAQIDDLIETYELVSDISNFTLWRRLQALNYSARRAASIFRQNQPQSIAITVAVASPLRVIVTDTYGAALAEARTAELLRLNDIDDPSLVPAGTSLRGPSPSAGRR